MKTELLSTNQRENATLTMSSREIEELIESDLVSILQKHQWFEGLNENTLNPNDAAILAFCLNKEIQKSVTSIYDNALNLAITNKFLECRELSEKIEMLQTIAISAESWFKNYPTLSTSFNTLRKVIFDVHVGLIMATSPCSSKYNRASNHKTYIVHNPKSNLIKIGKSISPKQRIRTLETQSGAKFNVLAIISEDRETELHNKFKEYRTLGEWFDDRDNAIRQFVNLLNQKEK